MNTETILEMHVLVYQQLLILQEMTNILHGTACLTCSGYGLMCQVMSACDYTSDLLRLCQSHVYKSSVIG